MFQWPSAMKYEFQVDEQRLQDGSVIASENGDTHRCLSALIESCKDCVYQNTWRHTIVSVSYTHLFGTDMSFKIIQLPAVLTCHACLGSFAVQSCLKN